MGNPFFEVTTVTGIGPGRYAAAIDDAWTLWPLPQGGIVTAIALRAMATELDDPAQRLRTLHTTFVGQVAHGPVEVGVELLRRGRSMSHLRAEVANPDRGHGHVTTAVFGSSRRGFEFTDLDPPAEVPPPDACRSFREPPPADFEGWNPAPFWEQRVEGRTVTGHAPWEEYVPDRAEHATWYCLDDPPMVDGALDPLALVVLADTMPGAVGEKTGREGDPWFAPSIDLTVHLFDACTSPWVLAHNRARHAGDGYASVDMALWDYGPDAASDPRLVAYATQLCLFSFTG